MPTLPRLKNSDNLNQWASKVNEGFEQLEVVGEGTLTTIDPLNSGEFIVYWGSPYSSLTNTNKAFGTHYNTDSPYQNLGDLTVTIPSNNHIVRNIAITDGGSGYLAAPYVTISNPYTGSTGFPGATGTTIDSVVGSTGFSSGTIVSSAFAISGATGVSYKFYKATAAIPHNSIVPLHSNGLANNWLFIGRNARTTVTISSNSIDSITMDDGGYGYSSLPSITVTPTSGGSGAVLTPEMYSDVVASLTVGSIDNKTEITSLTDGTRATDYLLVYDSSTLKKIKISTITPDIPTGAVLFGSPTDSYTWDSSNFYWDDSNNRLGLGTISPDALLTVSGVGAFGDGSTGFPSITNTGDLDTGFWFPLSNSIAASTAGVERIRIDSSGNIGVGTINPDALLTVSGVGAFGDGTVSAPSITNTGDLNTGLWFPAADTIAASTTGVERIRIDSSGNVGIGTNSPGYALDVKSLTGNVALKVTNAGANDNVQIRFQGNQTNVEQWSIGNNVATSGTGRNFDIFDVVSLTNRFRIDSTGNVGIGTTSPSYKLDIVGDTNISTGSVYRINGTSVLSATSLGSGIISSSLTSVGTITSGTWNGTVITGQYGGTGVNNSGKTISLGGNLTTSGAYNLTLTLSNTTNVTLPTSGTLLTNTSRTVSLTGDVIGTTTTDLTGNVSIATTIVATSIPAGSNWTGNVIQPAYGGTGVANTGTLTLSGAFNLTLALSATTIVTLPSSGTLATLAGSEALINKTSFNNVYINPPALTAVLTIGSAKTVTISNTLTFTGTDQSTVAFGAGGTVLYTSNATSADNPLTVVQRDASGNFSAGTITASINSTTFLGTTSLPLSRASANQAITGILSIAMPGSTSGTVTLQPTATAGTTTITLPATTGTVITTGDSGTVTNTMLAGSIANSKLAFSYITINGSNIQLGGSISITAAAGGSNTQVQYNSSGSFAGSSNFTFDGTRATIAALTVDSNTGTNPTLFVDATNNRIGIGTSTPSQALQVIGTIAANTFSGSGAGLTTIPNSALSNSTISGISLGSNLATLIIGSFLTGGSYNGSSAVTIAVDATSANTASKVVSRDASGNFSAGTITANLSGNASTATTATNISGQANSATITATSDSIANRIVLRDASGNFSAETITAANLIVSGALTATISGYVDTSTNQTINGTKIFSSTISANITGTAFNITQYTVNQNVGTTNSPSFAGLTVDTNTLYVDATNDRVGIGTLSPAYKLDVDGVIKASSYIVSGSKYLVSGKFAGGATGPTGSPLAGATENYDPGGNFNATTGEFTAPQVGFYLCNISYLTPNDSSTADLKWKKNNNNVPGGTITNGSPAGHKKISHSIVISADFVGDKFTLISNGTSNIHTDSEQNSFSIILL